MFKKDHDCTRSPGSGCPCGCMNVFLSEKETQVSIDFDCINSPPLPDHLEEGGRGLSPDPGVPQLRQLLVVLPRVVAQPGGKGGGQLEEGNLAPVHLGVALQQLETLRRH